MKHYLLLILAAACTGLAALAADAEVLATRAGRAYANGEWASAEALYQLVSDARPTAPAPYARIIIAGMMRGDSTTTAPTVERALTHGVPLDSVLCRLETDALALGQGGLYAGRLHCIARELPYLKRPCDARLLDYYTYRRDAGNMVRYAQALLRGLPDNSRYLNILAQGYMLQGEMDEAMNAWRRAIDADPNSEEALLYLGYALLERGDSAGALPLLRRAYGIHPTPELKRLLGKYEAK